MTPAARACISCQTPLPADAQFCPRCGTRTPTQISGGGTTTGVASSEPTAAQQRRVQAALGPDYDVQRRIGSGGFAEVWAAFDRKLQRAVAVKVLHPDLVTSRSLLERFQREAQAVAKLRHPGVIPIYAVGEYEGLAYYIMPLVEGESLRDRLTREGPLPPDEVRRLLRESAAALAGAHEAGIVHRDIKPENLMLEGKDRRLLVMDFGIAKSTAGTQAGLTGTGMIVGTPTYMSPEQATGSKEVDVRSDIYSLGVVGFELLTGKPPFTSQSVPELLLHHVSTPAPSVAAGRTDVPEDLAIAVNRCLAKDPGERWKDAGELSAFLEILGTPTSQPKVVSRDLRRYARRRWKPTGRQVFWTVLGGAALVSIGLVTVSTSGLRETVRYWTNKVGLTNSPPPGELLGLGSSVKAGSMAGVSPAWSAVTAFVSRPWWLGELGDSLLVTFLPSPEPTLRVFDGAGWSEMGAGARSYFPPARVRDTLVVVESDQFTLGAFDVGNSVRRFAWTSNGLRVLDTIPVGAVTYWTDGRTELVGDISGGVFHRAGSQWIREPTGTTHWLSKIVGRDRSHLAALSPEMSDSLLVNDGGAWHLVDPRPTRTGASSFAGIAVLGDGTTILVGTWEGPEPKPLLLQQDTFGGRWSELRAHFPDGIDLVGAWGNSREDFLVWGRETCALAMPCVFRIARGHASPVQEFAGLTILSVIMHNGSPHALTSDGRIWAQRGGRWSPVAELPGSAFRFVGADSAIGVFAATGSNKLVGSLGNPSVFTSEVTSSVLSMDVRDSVVAVITKGNLVVRWPCVPGRWGPGGQNLHCDADTLRSNVAGQLRTVAVLDRAHTLAAGDGGALVLWVNHHPTQLRLPPEVRGDTLLAIVRRRGAPTVILGLHSILALDSDRVHLLGRWPSRTDVTGATALADRRVVFVARESGLGTAVRAILPEHPSSWLPDSIQRLRLYIGSAVTVHALPDGRLVMGIARPDDPAAGGFVEITHGGFHGSERERVNVPDGFDVYGLADDGRYLYVGGRGWSLYKIPLDSLPFSSVRQHRVQMP